jgi:hypothetical protein
MIMARAVAKQREAQANTAAAADVAVAADSSATAASSSPADSAPAAAPSTSFPPIFILETGFKGWVRYVARLDEQVRTKQRDTLLADYSKEAHGYSC